MCKKDKSHVFGLKIIRKKYKSIVRVSKINRGVEVPALKKHLKRNETLITAMREFADFVFTAAAETSWDQAVNGGGAGDGVTYSSPSQSLNLGDRKLVNRGFVRQHAPCVSF